ncbi:MAG: peptidoglycan DD-metalloendopeptidase family protein [Bacteroidia bacterium]|nr:peptidoglycan DD-metalloendopeptidase family protein [Bacteroidia bacterium]MCX7764003.1 peptidoglycan DD-metalloendopeptidase family protein [Bacteroidia bacterium]MDW8056865.1 peptidoglycan DD-metalloendopeptidase family protein [Bacteroidia bacterium]
MIRLGLLVGILWAQTRMVDFSAERKRLERRRQQIEMELRQAQELLQQTRKEKQRSLAELSLLRRQIALREKLLYGLQQEINLLEQDIYQLATVSQALERDLRRLYRNYVWSLYLLDKAQRQISPWIWILSAESFRQAYERLFYFRAVSRFRQEQLLMIERTQKFLESRSAALRKSREEKHRLLLLHAEQTEALQKARAEKRELYRALRQKESSYRQRLVQSRKELERIQKRIDELIRAEVEQAGKASPTAAERRIAGAFEQNKGNLPWPIASDRLVVISPFGTVEDESGGLITNHGVYLAGPPEAEVRAIFSGKVTAVTTIPGQGKVVIIQHGPYRTVYARLRDTYVQVGQSVGILTPIGRLSPATEDEPPQLYFLIYKGKTPMNPLEWVASR